jgi:hypothetical protein
MNLSRALDRAVAAENRRALTDPTPPAPMTVRYPEGTPEYAAYQARLRTALAEWVTERAIETAH